MEKNTYTNGINSDNLDFISINNIFFKNYIIYEGNSIDMPLRVKGDIYTSEKDSETGKVTDVCLGYYNPDFKSSKLAQTEKMIRIEDQKKHMELKTKFKRYQSMFEKPMSVLTSEVGESVINLGFEVLLTDLEQLFIIGDFMQKRFEECIRRKRNELETNIVPELYDFDDFNLLGICNWNLVNVIKAGIDISKTSDQDLKDMLEKHTNLVFDSQYPVLFFRKRKDFYINDEGNRANKSNRDDRSGRANKSNRGNRRDGNDRSKSRTNGNK